MDATGECSGCGPGDDRRYRGGRDGGRGARAPRRPARAAFSMDLGVARVSTEVRSVIGKGIERLTGAFPQLTFTPLRETVRPGETRSVVLLFGAACAKAVEEERLAREARVHLRDPGDATDPEVEVAERHLNGDVFLAEDAGDKTIVTSGCQTIRPGALGVTVD